MTHLATLITDLALLLIVAGITTLLCKRLKQPTVIGYILAGFLIGPVVDFVPTLADVENINLWAEIGIIFLMFGLGLEFSLHKLASVGSTGITAASVAGHRHGGRGFCDRSADGLERDEQYFLRRYAFHVFDHDHHQSSRGYGAQRSAFCTADGGHTGHRGYRGPFS